MAVTDVKKTRDPFVRMGTIMVAVLLLAGCAQAPAGLLAGPSAQVLAPADTTTSAEPATPRDAEPVEADAPASPAPDSAAPAAPGSSSGEACLAGNWKMDNDLFAKTMLKLMKAHPEAAKVAKDVRASGDRLLWFGGDGKYGTTDDRFVMTIVGTSGGKTVDMVTTLDSARVGSYGAVDGFVWVAETETLLEDVTLTIEGMQLNASTTLDGPTDVELFGFSAQVPNMPRDRNMDGVAIYRCSGNELELEADGGLINRFTRK